MDSDQCYWDASEVEEDTFYSDEFESDTDFDSDDSENSDSEADDDSDAEEEDEFGGASALSLVI